MLINEASKLTKLTKKAIEYYTLHGLISPIVLKNGYRDYSNDAYTNTPNDGITGAWQNRVPRKGEIPTVEEFIKYATVEVNKRKKDEIDQRRHLE